LNTNHESNVLATNRTACYRSVWEVSLLIFYIRSKSMKPCASIVTIVASLIPFSNLLAQTTLNPSPSKVIGELGLNVSSLAPNLVQGRELNSPGSVAIDTNASPPILYVSDSGNNRVLAWKNALALADGAPADKVIGQKDLFSTFPQGPGRGAFSTGLTGPAGLAVDKSGNLYVVDSGNNRILRFPKPFNQSTQVLPDLVIGQASFGTRGTNQNGISAASIALNSDPNQADCLHANCYDASLAFDSQGNLYFTDALNNRILRYPASSLGANAANGVSADIVLGQSGFLTASYNNDPTDPHYLKAPAGLAIDPAGFLYVSDSLNRVAVYPLPPMNGEPASRFLGVNPATANQQIQTVVGPSSFTNPEGLVMIGQSLGVADVGNHRILVFPPISQWNSNAFTQSALSVIGQNDFTSHLPNRGQAEPSAISLASPLGAVFFNGQLFIADALNNRVLEFQRQGTTSFGTALLVLGQIQFNYNTVNLIEGRELHLVMTNSQGSFGDGGIVIDTKSTPPHLYIADPYNNRVLGFKDARTVKTGATADLVIGQQDLFRSQVNAPSNDSNRANDQGLNLPTGLALDAQGNLFVADSLNGRIVRFPSPFNGGNFPHADLVIGQSDFSTHITDPTPVTMNLPYGLAFSADRSELFVSDAALNRVLVFGGASQPFTNGMSATNVSGQQDFFSSGSGGGPNMTGPREIAVDSSNRLYVTDAGNNRIQIYDANQPVTGPLPVFTLNTIDQNRKILNPRGIYLNQATGQFWVAAQDSDNGNGILLRYPNFDSLALSTFAVESIPEIVPITVAEDGDGALYVSDFANRVVIFYPAIRALNGASSLSGPLAPGTITSIYPQAPNLHFGSSTVSSSGLPLPNTLGDVQVTVNGQPSPLFFVGPGQINFIVPSAAPTSGTAEVDVVKASTGQILGAYRV